MPMRTGCCEICGDEFIQMNKVRKYCTVCQGIRDVQFRPTMKRKCSICDTIFYPIKQNYVICNDCREPIERPDKYAACKGCGKHLRPAPGLNSHCMSCVQRTPKSRHQWLKSVLIMQRNRGVIRPEKSD